MDIDYILSTLFIGTALLLVAFLIGFSQGLREGFAKGERIWKPLSRSEFARTRKTDRVAADILDAEEIG